MKNRVLVFSLFFWSVISLCAQSPVLKNPTVEKIATGFNFIEGPLWIENEGLLFSDIPENKVYLLNTSLETSTYITPSGKSNGLALNADGELLMCQHLTRQVGKYVNENIVTVASHYDGKKLNSPNDLVVKSTGTIFFTDPPFGLDGAVSDLGYAGIYSITSDGKVHLLDNSMEFPNGITFSPDEKKLYVIDSQIADIYVWDVDNDTTLSNKKLFFDMDTNWGDGMKTDSNGYIYVTAENGLTIFSPDGIFKELITFDGGKSANNCAWGSKNGKPTMYVTANKSIFLLKNKVEVGLNEQAEPTIKKQINIYQNPSTNAVDISLLNADNKELNVYIYSTLGKLIDVLPKKNFGLDNKITYSAKTAGLYYVVIEANNEFLSEKFVVIN